MTAFRSGVCALAASLHGARLATAKLIVQCAGYRVSSTHANPLGTKTDAPWEVVWDIMRAWVKDHPVKAMVRSISAVASWSEACAPFAAAK